MVCGGTTVCDGTTVYDGTMVCDGTMVYDDHGNHVHDESAPLSSIFPQN